MTDAWEMHQAETGLNPGPVWRDRGVIIANLTARNQALEERVAELELAALNLRDNTQGAHEREQALREHLTALANEMDERGKPDANDSALDAQSRRQIREDAKRLRALAPPAEDTTPEPTPAAECTCAMTEASQRTCPLHGEDDWLTPSAEPQAEDTTPTEQQAQGGA